MGRWGICVALISCVLSAAGASAGGPALQRRGSLWVLSGASLELAWDSKTGALAYVKDPKTETVLLEGARRPFDLHTEAGWVFENTAARARRLGALSLDGKWDFHVEGGKWTKISVPGTWESQGFDKPGPKDPDPTWEPYNGNGYYRRSFDLPPALRGKDLVLYIGRVDDFDWVTVNGHAVGHTGDEVENWWAAPRRYTVRAGWLKPSGNIIEVRVYDRGGEGGILGPVLLMTRQQAAILDQPAVRLTAARLTKGDAYAVVTLTLEAPGWQARDTYAVAAAGRAFFYRNLELTAVNGAGGAKFDRLDMFLGGVSKALEAGAHIAAPYTWPPIDRPLAEFTRDGNAALHCGQAVTGVAVYWPGKVAMAVGQYWERDWNIFVAHGYGDTTRLSSQYMCQGRLRAGLRIPAGGQFVMVASGTDRAAAVRAIARGWQRLGFKLAPLPRWAEDIALYSLYPGGTMGSGLRDLRSPGDKPPALRNFQRLQLPILKRLGINAIWFLPLWPRMYAVSDYWSIHAALGSVGDLRAVVADAHSAGIRVLCDLIPHGPHASSGLAKEHPDFVSRNEDGSMRKWWGCLACDYANPAWQDYMARVATYWVKKADIDGWRVDVAGGSLPNWRPYDDNLPSWSGQWGGLRLMERVRKALTALKPDAVLLAETSNPPMLSQAHFIYDWPTERAFFQVLKMRRAQWVADMRKWLEMQRLALPEGAAARLMRFTENHDQLHSVWQLGPNLARSIWALMTLAEGFPLLYHEQEVGFEDFWRELLTARRQISELHSGAADYSDAVACSAPDVLAFVRRDGEGASVVLVSFAGAARRCKVTWAGAPARLRYARALRSGRWIELPRSAAGAKKRRVSFELTLAPYDWEVVVLREGRRELADLKAPEPMNPPPAEAAAPEAAQPEVVVRLAGGGGRVEERAVAEGQSLDQRAGELKGVTVECGSWKAVFRDGLLAGLWAGDAPLVGGMWVVEGPMRLSWGAPLWMGQRMSERSEGRRGGAVARVVSWRVEKGAGAATLDFTCRGGDFAVATHYVVGSEGVVRAAVKLTPLEKSERVLGQLRVALGAGGVERWAVHTIEGDVGGPFFVRHPTPRELTGRYWHPIQRLWESSVLPLDLRRPSFGWQVGGRWLWMELPDAATAADSLDDVYLREYAPDGRGGLTAYLAWMEGRRGRALDPARPLVARFNLYVGRQPPARHLALRVKFWTDGSNWYVKGRGYTVCIGRSAGGHLRRLWTASDRPVVEDAATYTDYGIMGTWTDPLGRKLKLVGSTAGDFEPDCRITAGPQALELRFRGYMRQRGTWRNVGWPRVEYEVAWRFGATERIGASVRCRVMTAPLPQRRAFLAQVMTLPDVERWQVEGGGQRMAGSPAADRSGRVWESARSGGAPRAIVFRTAGGAVRFEDFRPVGADPQNIFFTRGRSSRRYSLFLAMLDGRPATVDARWRGVRFAVVPGGE